MVLLQKSEYIEKIKYRMFHSFLTLGYPIFVITSINTILEGKEVV